MRFLADESVDFAITQALRSVGHDVRAVSEDLPGSPDEAIVKFATREKRLLLTEDRDFGRLVFAQRVRTAGVLYLRYPFRMREEMAERVVQIVAREGEQLYNAYVVIQPGRARISRLHPR